MKKFFASLLMLFVIIGFSLATIGCGGGNKPAKPADTKPADTKPADTKPAK